MFKKEEVVPRNKSPVISLVERQGLKEEEGQVSYISSGQFLFLPLSFPQTKEAKLPGFGSVSIAATH